MRGLDEPVAFEVRSFESFGPVAMHDPIEHDIDPGEIGSRFKDGRVSQRRNPPPGKSIFKAVGKPLLT